jgi:hypothetical protein
MKAVEAENPLKPLLEKMVAAKQLSSTDAETLLQPGSNITVQIRGGSPPLARQGIQRRLHGAG